ncbi:insulinase family protein [Candidatus Pacearchaeota archaeon]|nr:insulinase family protein [Candidatus Pacearchaeota archaeon]
MKFFKKTLSNGVTVIMEKRDLPVVALSVSNKFGAAYETSPIKGIAHFVEHLVFTGTKTRTHEDISREIEKKGGILNAFTSNEVTSFWFKMPSEHVFAGLDIISDMLINSQFRPDKFEKEKKVILEEIKMYHDTPQHYVFEKIEQNLYDKPLGEGIIGSEKTIKALDRDFVADYFKKVYMPENYIVTVVGNADFEAICSYFEKNFKKGGKKISQQPIKLKNGESMEKRPGIDQAHFVFAIHAPLPNSEDHTALEVLDAYLANGMSSRLFLKIREEKGLAYAVKSSINAEKNYSYYSIYVGTTKEAVSEVKKIIIEEFNDVRKTMNQKNLQEAKERLIGLRKISSEESSMVMNELLFSELRGNAEDYYTHEEKIKKVTLEDVKRVSQIKSFSTAAIVPD